MTGAPQFHAAAVDDASINPLRIFTKAPTDRDSGVIVADLDGVLIREGEVAVYDRHPMQAGEEGLIDGGLYAIEYQNPVAGMSWEMWWDKGDHQRSRIRISRKIVILRRHHKLAEHWVIHPLARVGHGMIQMCDGPIPERILYDKLIGRIVGIYNPTAFAEVRS
jgi:hypothetical protein